ncbi:transporter substrate-binding domain-containing protein [Streptococcus sp. DD13]|uniref:transporter substrate-binding domain-containing protein n=1 Tax=Streptococcus sp. DD13 TaxID=1777881 RepID=UPI00079BD216|nr:transporter substrate-binding domain-containing protein [Streptococcus sp. DD13]KXT79328.1 Glutamine ABC transporter, periplasmic glutamine-binding protein [Streptococcus sp. DD13]
MKSKKTILGWIVAILFLAIFVFPLFIPKTSSKATNGGDSSDPVQAIKNRGILRVGIKQDVPNFGYLNPDTNAYEGMEIDIARKIADELGVDIEFTPVTPQTRGAVLDNDQVDIVIATFTINEERKKLYNFSTPYYTDAVGFLVNNDSGITSIKDLNGKNIGVAQGSTTRTQIQALAKENNISVYFTELGSYPELAVALRAHRIDAFSVDQSILSGYTSSTAHILDFNFATSEYGIVTKKSNTALNEYVSNLISQWKTDGTLQKIYAKYNLTPVESTQQ